MFQREFSCRAIMFTTSEPIIRLCNAFGITTDHEFEENPYGIPYIGSLFMRAASLYQGHFYGYINADILLSTTLFTILPFILEQRVNFFPDRMVVWLFAFLSLLVDRTLPQFVHHQHPRIQRESFRHFL